MSKLLKEITLPDSVKISKPDKSEIELINNNGSKIKLNIRQDLINLITIDGNKIIVSRDSIKKAKTLGLHSDLVTNFIAIKNSITGVVSGFHKTVKLSGIGYKVSHSKSNKNILKLELSKSHSTFIEIPNDIMIKIDKNEITFSSTSNQHVSNIAKILQNERKTEPYKLKGMSIDNELEGVKKKEIKKKA